MSIEDYTTEELKALIEKRIKSAPVPQPVENPDWTRLAKYVHEGMEEVWKGGWRNEPKDMEEYVFEIVFRTLYGNDIFDVIEQREKDLGRAKA